MHSKSLLCLHNLEALALCNKYLWIWITWCNGAGILLCSIMWEGNLQPTDTWLPEKQIHTYTYSPDPILSARPQSSGRYFLPWIVSSAKDDASRNTAAERIYWKVMMLSNISAHFSSTNSLLSTCHMPGMGLDIRKKMWTRHRENKSTTSLSVEGLCVFSQSHHRVWSKAVSKCWISVPLENESSAVTAFYVLPKVFE